MTFTRCVGRRYRVDVARALDPPAAMHVAPGFDDYLPHDLVHFLVEREFGLQLGIFGQLAAGGDAVTFWCAPRDRTTRLAQRAHRLRVAGRGDLGRSEQLAAACVAAWEIQAGRRRPGEVGAVRVLHDAALASPAQIARVVEVLGVAATAWHQLAPGESLRFEWPKSLTLPRVSRLRTA
ncbi:MAG: hypothetical protein ACRDV3_01585 [Acidothermaceae bacterium]